MEKTTKTYWNAGERKALSTNDLQTMYANAWATRCCLGRGKSEANKINAKKFYDELKSRGVAPDGREGQFNGPGAR